MFDDIAARVYKRQNPGTVALDPVTIALLISAIITIAKQVYDCYKKRHPPAPVPPPAEVLASYREWGPLGWLRRKRVRAVLARKKVLGYEDALLAEVASMADSEFRRAVTAAAARGAAE